MELRGELLLACLLALMCSAWAARRVDANARAQDTMRRRRESAVMKRQEPETLDAKELLQLTEGESMAEVAKTKDVHGSTIERLQEMYKGVPVLDSIVSVRKDEKGHMTGQATGTLVQDIGDDLQNIESNLTDEEVFDIVIKTEGDGNRKDLIGDKSSQRFVFLDSKSKARLVSLASYSIDGEKKPMYIIDLKSGEVLKHWNSFMTVACCYESPVKAQLIGGNEKMGKVTYGSQPYCLDFTVDDCDICYLENKYVRVVDMLNSANESISETASFPCNEIYNDTVNGAYSPAIDAFFHGTVVGMMFEEWYGETALKEKMIIRVHYREYYQNAFWNGVNATFGDGGFYMYPLTSLDVVGHEFGHGVVMQASNLFYFDESGGMNEAFADMMGEASEAYAASSDFMTGANIMKTEPYLREFENPGNDNHSIGHSDQMTKDMDPHLSSGVYRRVWYVATKEQGMPIKDAFKVFLYANRMYWHYMSTFFDGSCGVLRAAMDLGMDTAPFALAFEDVGIPPCNVSDHIVSLTNNRTQRGVSVSETIQPVFAFSVPPWAKEIYVEAVTPSTGDIQITILKGTWQEEEYDDADIVAEGLNIVEYNLNSNETEEQYYRKRDYTSTSYPSDKSTDGTYSHTVTSSNLPSESSESPRSTTGSNGHTTDGAIYSTGDDIIFTNDSNTHGYTTDAGGSTSYSRGYTTDGSSYTDSGQGGSTTERPSSESTRYPESSTSSRSGSTDYPSPWDTTPEQPLADSDHQFFIKLSVGYWRSYNDVEVTAGYVCLDDYRSDDYRSYMFYRYYCFGGM